MEKTITFSVSGNEITGTLQGNAHLWMFESENPYFKSKFDSGKITKHTFFKTHLIEVNQNEIYSLVCEEAEMPGF